MSGNPKSPNRFADAPRDRPMTERTEHANLERPGAQAHPCATRWSRAIQPVAAWRNR